MSIHILLLTLSLTAAGAFDATSYAHGGAYRGAGDAIPPGSGSSPASGGSTPGPSGPTPPTGPVAPPGASTAPGAPASVPTTRPTIAPPDSVWQLWWGYNSPAFLDIKGAVHSSDLVEGSDSFFLGRRSPELARDRLTPSDRAIRERIVPALVRVLDEERDADMLTGALIALAKIGERGAGSASISKRIAEFLPDANQEVAETAAISLGILADRDSVGILTAILFDQPAARELMKKSEVPWRSRAFAAYGLGLIGYRVDDELLRTRIVESLSRALVEGGLELATPDVSVACLSALGLVPLSLEADAMGKAASGRQRQIEWLLGFGARDDLNDAVAAHVPTAVARLAADTPPAWGLHTRLGEMWVENLAADSSASRTLQQSSALALGRIGDADEDPIDRAMRRALVRASLSGDNIEVRRFALIALAQIGTRAGTGDGASKGRAEIRTHLVSQLEKGSTGVRPWAGIALGVFGRGAEEGADPVEGRIDELLVGSLGAAKSPSEVGAYAIACGIRRSSSATKTLLAKLESVRDDETRGYIALALGMIGAAHALEPIQEVVRHSKYRPELLRQSAISLGLLGDKNGVPELIEMLKNASSLFAQASIAYGLGAIGDARSIDPLIEMLEDPEITPRARAFAAVALGIVSDKEERPWNAKLSIGINYRANTSTLTDGKGAGVLEIL